MCDTWGHFEHKIKRVSTFYPELLSRISQGFVLIWLPQQIQSWGKMKQISLLTYQKHKSLKLPLNVANCKIGHQKLNLAVTRTIKSPPSWLFSPLFYKLTVTQNEGIKLFDGTPMGFLFRVGNAPIKSIGCIKHQQLIVKDGSEQRRLSALAAANCCT